MPDEEKEDQSKRDNGTRARAFSVVLIGASVGGIAALTEVISGLPRDLPAAVLVVQHTPQDRSSQLAAVIGRRSQLPVFQAEEGEPVVPGTVVIAPPGRHLVVKEGRLAFSHGSPVNHVRPSVDVFFASAAKAFGSRVIAVVLTGSGNDGAQGCRHVKEGGGAVIVQDEETSAFFGMPDAAIRTGCADAVLPLPAIAPKIREVVGRSSGPGRPAMEDNKKRPRNGVKEGISWAH